MNLFFRIMAGNPELIWKLSAGLLFAVLGLVIGLVPSFIQGLEDKSRYIFSSALLTYSLFRLGTFYVAYKRIADDKD